jgi:hypothetical protein
MIQKDQKKKNNNINKFIIMLRGIMIKNWKRYMLNNHSSTSNSNSSSNSFIEILYIYT